MLDTPFFWAGIYLLGAIIVCAAWFRADYDNIALAALAWPLIVLALPLLAVGSIAFRGRDWRGQ